MTEKNARNIDNNSTIAICAFAFGVTTWMVLKYQQQTIKGKEVFSKDKDEEEKKETASTDYENYGSDISSSDDNVTSSSARIVRYLSGYSEWSEYCDDDELFIQTAPKIELHVHLDGTFDPDFLWKYIKEHPESLNCLPVTSNPPWQPNKPLQIRTLVEKCQQSRDFHTLCTCRGYRSLNEMLNCFEIFLPLVRGNLHLIEQLAYDFCQREWEQNVIYAEVRYSPHLFAEGFSSNNTDGDSNDNNNTQITAEAVYQAVTKGLRRGCESFVSLTVNQILCSINWRPDWASETLDLAIKYRDDGPCSVVGVDIAAGEEHFDKEKFPNLYQPHFDMAQRAKEHNIPLTIHAGEATDQALANVTKAIKQYGACRIGHGYRMVNCTKTMDLVRDNKIHVEVCPTSSDETGGWVYDESNGGRDWKKHPLTTMMTHGISVSLSSDDPAVFHTSLSWQYRIAVAKMELNRKDLVHMNLEAINAAFCTEDDKKRLRKIVQCFGRQQSIDGLNIADCTDCTDPRTMWERSSTGSFSDRVYINADEYI